LRELARRGGKKPKRLCGVDLACKALKSLDISAESAWERLKKHGFTSDNGRYTLSVERDHLVQKDGLYPQKNYRPITQSTFRTGYWTKRLSHNFVE
jgi:hypothetical protein